MSNRFLIDILILQSLSKPWTSVLSVYLPIEKGKKASWLTKFPSLSKKCPGLNCRGVSHCSGSYNDEAIFGRTMVPWKEKTTNSALAVSPPPAVRTGWVRPVLVYFQCCLLVSSFPWQELWGTWSLIVSECQSKPDSGSGCVNGK